MLFQNRRRIDAVTALCLVLAVPVTSCVETSPEMLSDAAVAALVQDIGGTNLVGSPAVTRWGERLDVWHRRSDGKIWHTLCLDDCSDAGNWTAWESGAGAPTTAMSGDPAAVAWGTGRIDLFVRTGSSLAHQTWVNGTGWLGWEDLGTSIDGSPAAVSWASGRLDVYARGTDGNLWHRACNTGNCRGGNWQAWEGGAGKPTAGLSTSRPGVVSRANNRLDIFVRGNDNAVWMRSWTGSSYSSWASLGGAVINGVAAASWGGVRLDIFAQGSDGILWQRTRDDTNAWRPWRTLAPPLNGTPTAITTGNGDMEIFYRGSTGTVKQISCNGDDDCEVEPTTTAQPGPTQIAANYRLDIATRTATGNDMQFIRCDGAACETNGQAPINLSPSLNSGAALTRWGARVDAFARGTDGRIWHKLCQYGCRDTANWSIWQPDPGTPAGGASDEPSAIAWDSGRIDLFVRSGNTLMHQVWDDVTGWRTWESLGPDIVSPPGVASRFRGQLEVYAVGGDGRLWRRACSKNDCYGGSDWDVWLPAASPPPGTTLVASRPAAVAWRLMVGGVSTRQMNVFARASDGRIWTASEQGAGGFGAWTQLPALPGGVTAASGVTAVFTQISQPSFAQSISVLVTGSDGNLWHLPQGKPWVSLGVTTQGPPAAISYVAMPSEDTAAVIAPGHASCPSGRAFVSHGGDRTIVQTDLNCIGTRDCTEYAWAPDPGDIAEGFGSADNQIRSTPDGRLLYVKQTFIQDATKPAAPVRVVEQFWTSADCGRTWAVQGRIDQAALGYPVLPQYCATPPTAAPGFDRVEIYIDPYETGTNYVYAAMNLTTGDPTDSTKCLSPFVLARSADFGRTWALANDDFGGATPFKITSTPDALVLFSCPQNQQPLVIWSRDRGNTYYWDRFDGQTCRFTNTYSGGPGGNGSVNISRVGTFPPYRDTFRVTYPIAGTTASLQAIRLATVRLDSLGEGGPTYVPGDEKPADWDIENTFNSATTSLISYTSIEPYDDGNTVLYFYNRTFVDAAGNATTFDVRYRGARGGSEVGSLGTATAALQPVSGWWGDYRAGGYYRTGTTNNYFIIWNQNAATFSRTISIPQGEPQ